MAGSTLININSLTYKDKICDLVEAKERMTQLRKQGYMVVFTNGCFDLLHKGHITYLERARDLGNYLVVGLNSDASVRRLKGEDRPIKSLESRSAVMAALGCVDMVIVFEEDTPKKLIEELNPNILVKGGDYNVDDIVGADFVLKNGGEVLTLGFEEGYSSSALIKKMERG